MFTTACVNERILFNTSKWAVNYGNSSVSCFHTSSGMFNLCSCMYVWPAIQYRNG